jgi:2-oxoglutarate ferredoxin oxidoreductase subunit gamma
MRGGTANCSVVVSDSEIGSAQLLEADTVIAMNLPSLHKFEPAVLKGGKLFINSSVIKEKATRSDIDVYYVDANTVAEKIGNAKGGNMVILGAYAKLTGTVTLDSLYELVKKTFTGDKAKFVESNIACIKAGAELF